MIKTLGLNLNYDNDNKAELTLGKYEDVMELYNAFIHDIKNGSYDLHVEKNTVHGKNIGLLVNWDAKYIMLVENNTCIQMIVEAFSVEEY